MNMAKRKYSKMSKIEPSVQTLKFTTPTIGATSNETFYIDLSQVASLMNRRFYRQGINWAVSGIKILTTGFQGGVIISKLPNTWVMSNAWEKGFRAWQHMIKNATDDQGLQSIKGKFLDFKIYADQQHHLDGYGLNLLPEDVSGATVTTGQWQPAEIELPSTTASPGQSFAYEIIAVGPNTPGVGASGLNAKSLIAGYEVSRALPNETDPNVPNDASSTDANWILGLFNDGTNQDGDVVQMLETTGDRAPYPYEGDGTNTDTQYPGGQNNLPGLQIHDFEFVSATTVGGSTRMKGGNFPCGLIRIDAGNTTDRAVGFGILVDLVPGNHRGYLCEPMTEM